MTFADVVSECAGNADLVREFNRLYGCNLGQSLTRKPIEAMVDRACGRPPEEPDDLRTFVWFVWEYVWSRLPPEAFAA